MTNRTCIGKIGKAARPATGGIARPDRTIFTQCVVDVRNIRACCPAAASLRLPR